MANTAQSKKRARQSERNRKRNIAQKSYMRTTVKNILKAIDADDKDLAKSNLSISVRVIDKTVSKGLIHKNKASRLKSRLNKRVKAFCA